MKAVPHKFQAHELVGGDLAVDFVNTVTARDSEASDWIASYDALLDWAGLSGAFAKKDLAALRALAHADLGKAAAAAGRARALREVLCAVLYAVADKRAPSGDDLAAVDAARLAAAKAAKLALREGRLQAVWSVERSGLDLIVHVVAARAVDLLGDVPLERLRVCDGHDCGWLFIDTSKNGRRRWCDMATCGNASKARRHAARRAGG